MGILWKSGNGGIIGYAAYFGPNLYKSIAEGNIQDNLSVVMVDFLAVVLAAVVLLNIMISKTKKVQHKHEVNWFYDDKKYERRLDERADKNNYRIY